jgi:hypothetical protein
MASVTRPCMGSQGLCPRASAPSGLSLPAGRAPDEPQSSCPRHRVARFVTCQGPPPLRAKGLTPFALINRPSIALSITPDQLWETACGRLPPLAQIMWCRIVASFLRHHASFQASQLLPFVAHSGQLACLAFGQLRRAGPPPCLAWARHPLDKNLIKGSAAFVPSLHSGTHPCRPPQPRPSHQSGLPRPLERTR